MLIVEQLFEVIGEKCNCLIKRKGLIEITKKEKNNKIKSTFNSTKNIYKIIDFYRSLAKHMNRWPKLGNKFTLV